MIEKLRHINNELIELSNDDYNLKKQRLIEKILSDDKCFFKISIEQAYAILRDLGLAENELKSIYMELIDIKSF